LMKLDDLKSDVWGRAEDIYLDKIGNLWSLTH
jgi:hypothetical protein